MRRGLPGTLRMTRTAQDRNLQRILVTHTKSRLKSCRKNVGVF